MAGEVAAWSEKEGAVSFVELLIVEGGERQILALSNNGFFFTVTSFCSNLLLCVFIAARLLQQQRHFASVLGPEPESPFRRIIVMCVESCALIMATIVTGGVFWFAVGRTYTMVPLLVLPQVCVSTSFSLKNSTHLKIVDGSTVYISTDAGFPSRAAESGQHEFNPHRYR